jgi:hypothetical protein
MHAAALPEPQRPHAAAHERARFDLAERVAIVTQSPLRIDFVDREFGIDLGEQRGCNSASHGT